jgi:hypothetical protein
VVTIFTLKASISWRHEGACASRRQTLMNVCRRRHAHSASWPEAMGVDIQPPRLGDARSRTMVTASWTTMQTVTVTPLAEGAFGATRARVRFSHLPTGLA